MRMNQTDYEARQEEREIFVRNLLRRGGFTDEDIAELAGIPLEEAIRIREKTESEGK